MYKKALVILTCVYVAMFGGILYLSGAARRMESGRAEERQVWAEETQIGIAKYSSSGRRIVDYLLLEALEDKECEEAQEEGYAQEEIEVLQRIVEAEAGGEDAEGKLLVANVILNRVRDQAFPNSISEVVFQKDGRVTQFSPVSDGSYERVTVSEETIAVVARALAGEDISQGALYFAARKYADSKCMEWFDENLTFLFQHGGHEFFR